MFQFSHWGQEQLHCSWIFTHRGWMWTTCMHFPLPPERHQLLRELKGVCGMRPQRNMGEASIPKFPEFIIHWKKTFPLQVWLDSPVSTGWEGKKSSHCGPKSRSSCWEQEGHQNWGKQIHSIVIQNGLPWYVLGLLCWATDHQASAFVQPRELHCRP